jgi:hypothetical protein
VGVSVISLKFNLKSKLQLVIFVGLAMQGLSACVSNDDFAVLTGVAVEATPTATPAVTSVGAPDKIQILAGNNQSGNVGAPLGTALIVKVEDANHLPVPGVSLTFNYAVGDGQLISSGVTDTTHIITTDASGLALVTAVLGNASGAQSISVSMPSGTVTNVTFNQTAIGVSTLLKIYTVGGFSPVGNTNATIGTPIQLRAVLTDTSGTFIKEVPATWWVTGTLQSGDLTITGGNPSKYATFNASLQSAGTVYAIIDHAPTIIAENITTTTTVTGQITAALALTPDIISVYSGNNQTTTVGTIPAQTLIAKVTNSAGVAVPGEEVTFTVTSGTGAQVVTNPATVVTNASGLAQVTVQAGTVVGNNTFTATMATNGSVKQTLFNLNLTPGTPSTMAFLQQPNYGSNGTPLLSQPIIELKDTYGNRVTTQNSGEVDLSIHTGAGVLGGFHQNLTFTDGLAEFINVSYSISEVGVRITATTDVGGIAPVHSNTFDVSEIITEARCDPGYGGAAFATAEGGCKDLTTGLVWSAVNTAVGGANMNWHQAVWNSAVGGAEVPEAWEVDRGITADVDYSAATIVDTSSLSYCHTLVESGLSDWRMPSKAELDSMMTHGGGTAFKNPGVRIFAATPSTATNVWSCIPSGGCGGGSNLTESRAVRCVRSPGPTKLTVDQQISAPTLGLGRNVQFENTAKIQISTPDGSVSSWSTNAVTLTLTSGSGQLCITNTTTGVTGNCSNSRTVNAVAGIATFSALTYNAADTFTVEATSPGLDPVTLDPVTVEATFPRALCKATNEFWANGNGGCKDVTTGITYSTTSINSVGTAVTMNWHKAIWDSTEASSDAYEAGIDLSTNDYNGFVKPASNVDNASEGYCHSLQQSGYNDWMMPSLSLSLNSLQVAGKTPGTNLHIPNILHWTSNTLADTSLARRNSVTNSADVAKTSSTSVFCVRREVPASINFFQQPGANANGFGAGVIWTNQPIIDIVDVDGAGPLFWDNAEITLEIVPASDATGGTGKFIQHHATLSKAISTSTSLTVNAVNGRYTASRLSYSKGGEKFRIKATATTTWKGTVYSLGPVYSTDVTVPEVWLPAMCASDDANFTSELGGCRDLGAGGLVWSHTFAATWAQVTWDSSVGGMDAAKTGEVITNDMDANNANGIGSDLDQENYCHSAHWGGFYDWRPPTFDEIDVALKTNTLGGRNGHAYMKHISAKPYLWSGKTHSSNNTLAYMFNMQAANKGKWYHQTTGVVTAYDKTQSYGGICVRDPNPSSTYSFP